jgi:acetyl-CoA C-acetyltransferase
VGHHAYESHQKAAAAWKEGFYDDLVVPFRGLERDNNLRPDSTLEKLARLSPAYDKTSGKGTLTAGNSTPLTDGASAVLLASDEWAAAHGHEPLAYIVDAETAAVDFVGHPRDGERVGADAEGLLMAPAYAVARLLRRRGLTLQDFDFYEIHEAFAGQVLCTLAAWEDEEYCRTRLGWEGALGSIDRSKLNVKGGSLAAGHPFAATGGRLVAGLAKILHEHGSGRGLISVCAAGGAGIVAILER